MYHFYFLITFDNGESYILRIRTNYVDRHAAVSRAKQVARIQFYGRRDKYELETLTLSNVLRQLCFDDNIVQLTEGVSMSVFFFQILLPGDDRTYFVRVQTKFSERKQARSKASRIAAARFDRLDFQCRPVSEDDVFGVIASGDSTDIEIFTAGCTDPGTGEQIKAMKKYKRLLKQIPIYQMQ